MTKDPGFSARSKHIEARYFFIRELVQNQRLSAQHIKSENNVADIFTKPLNKEDHYRFTTQLGVKPKPGHLEGAATVLGGVL